MTTREELDALLEAATAPLPPPPEPKKIRDARHVGRFLRENRIERGCIASVEVSTLYKFYRQWAGEVDAQPRQISPNKFGRALVASGFRRRKPPGLPRWERDRKCLLVRKECAQRLIAWSEEHPTTLEDRRLFNRRARYS